MAQGLGRTLGSVLLLLIETELHTNSFWEGVTRETAACEATRKVHAPVFAIAALVPACFFQAVPAERAAYVTSSSTSSVYVIDTASEAVAETIPNDGSPSQVVVAPGGLTAYISSIASDSIAIVDTASNAIIDSIPVGDAPSHLALTPDAATIYVSTSGGVIQCVDIATKTITADIPLFGVGGRLTITPDGRLYVAWWWRNGHRHHRKHHPYDILSGNSAGDVAISPDGTRAYIATTHYEFDPVFSAYGAIAGLRYDRLFAHRRRVHRLTPRGDCSINGWHPPLRRAHRDLGEYGLWRGFLAGVL